MPTSSVITNDPHDNLSHATHPCEGCPRHAKQSHKRQPRVEIDPEVVAWLQGQVDAIKRLTNGVAETLKIHHPSAAEKLNRIHYACNSAWNMLDEARSGKE